MGIKLLIADDEDVVRNGITKYIQLHTDRYVKKFMVQKRTGSTGLYFSLPTGHYAA